MLNLKKSRFFRIYILFVSFNNMFKKLFGKPTPKPILEPPPDVFKITQIYTGYSEAQQAFNRLKPSHYGIDVDTSNFQLHIPGWGR
jgi:hypothetical protein